MYKIRWETARAIVQTTKGAWRLLKLEYIGANDGKCSRCITTT